MVRCEREVEDEQEIPQCVVHARLGRVAKQEPAALGGGEEREASCEAVGNRRPHAAPGEDELRAADGVPEHDDAGIDRGRVADPHLGAEGSQLGGGLGTKGANLQLVEVSADARPGLDLNDRKVEHGARAVDADEEVHVVDVRERKLTVLEAGADGAHSAFHA